MTPNRRRPSYTLLEVMLVMAIMVMVSALSFPSLDSMYGYYKLNAAVDSVRAAWALARAHASTNDLPYRFSVVQGQGNYRLAPDSGDYWSGSNTPIPEDPDNPPAVIEDALPRGVRFSMGQSGPSTAGNSDDENTSTSGQVDSGSWSTVAVFMPDGTAREDVAITFQVKGATTTTIYLRALTGTVTVKATEEANR